MPQAVIEIEIPSNLLPYNLAQEKVQDLVTQWLAIDLFITDQISSGKAAQLLGINRLDFLDLLHKKRIAYLDLSDKEWAEELETIDSIQFNTVA